MIYLNTFFPNHHKFALKILEAERLGHTRYVNGFGKEADLFNLAHQTRSLFIVENVNSLRLNQPKICVSEKVNDFLQSDDFRSKSVDMIVHKISFPALYALTTCELPVATKIYLEKLEKKGLQPQDLASLDNAKDKNYREGVKQDLAQKYEQNINGINNLMSFINEEITLEEKIKGKELFKKINDIHEKIQKHTAIYQNIASLSKDVRDELNDDTQYRPKFTIGRNNDFSSFKIVTNESESINKFNNLAKEMQTNLFELYGMLNINNDTTKERTDQLITEALSNNPSDKKSVEHFLISELLSN